VGILTAREDLTGEVAEVFNLLTTQSSQPRVEDLLVAPFNMMDGLLGMIDREIAHAQNGRPARVVAKMNALQEEKVIRALYRASQEGVDVDLVVRGICCLRPGVPGVSDRIRARSIVGRYLEHSRIYSFENGGHPEVYIGSADWMPRNLRRRVEVLMRVDDREIAATLRDRVLGACLSDNTNAWTFLPDGSHARVKRGKAEAAFAAQDALMAIARGDKVTVPRAF
jgi:polyphosphate kinase